MVIAVGGNNSFQVKAHTDVLIKEFVKEHGDLALEKLDAEEVTYEQILGAVESLPFLASKKMVVVSEMAANKQAAEAVDAIIQRSGDTTDVILVEFKKYDKRSNYYKQLKKLADLHEYNDMDEAQLADWLVGESDGKLTKSDARYLVQRAGTDQLKLSHELQKLIQYGEINKKSIDLLVDENPSSTIFNLIDSVFSGNLKQALQIYDDQRKQRVEPQAIHGMLVWQMHAVAVVSAAPGDAQVAKEAGLSPFVVQKAQRIARQMGRAKIIEFMKLLRDIDYRGKHEIFDYDEALRYAIVTLAN